VGDHCTTNSIDGKTHHRRLLLSLDHFPTLNNRKDKTMTIIDSDYRYQPATTPKEHAVPAKRRRRVTVKSNALTSTDKVALLQSAVEVRQTLRNSLEQVNTLIREVKVQRKQDRLLQTTMDSLRKLGLA